ncbi:ribonuclease H-like domain-containing protein [Tanacetum coccineum]
MYENFNATSTKSVDTIFNRLQKIVSQVAILGEIILQEDLNLNFLRSLPSEWNTHVVVWRNKPDLDTKSFDDLYNNFKIVEQELALLSMRARRYYQRTSKKITINRSDTASYDKSKVECFNCHKMGHFAKECRGPKNQESRPRNQDSSKRTMNVEETFSKAMVAIDGSGFDWSFMADEEVPTNMALMAFSDSEVYNDKTCSNTCLKRFETLKTQYDNLRIEFNKYEFDLATYKRGLAFIEEQLVFYKKNEAMFYEQIDILKRDITYKDSNISVIKCELEKLKKKKESNKLKIDKFENASKSLDKLIWSQITDNSRKGIGYESYNAITPPPTGLFAPPTIDLSNSSLEEFQQPEFEGYGPKDSKSVCVETSNKVKKTPDTSLVEEPKTVKTARPNSIVVNVVRENQVNDVKASACWVWRPTKLDSASITSKRHNYVDARGRSRDIHKMKIKDMLTTDAQGT